MGVPLSEKKQDDVTHPPLQAAEWPKALEILMLEDTIYSQVRIHVLGFVYNPPMEGFEPV